MPYIEHYRRDELFDHQKPRVPGELNYIFSRAINDFLNNQRFCYQAINDVLGALEGAKMEFYRRVAVPYEEKKLKENGDVYDKEFTQ